MKKAILLFLATLLLLSPAIAPNTAVSTTASASSEEGYYTSEGIWLSNTCVNACHQYGYRAELNNEGKKEVDYDCYSICIRKGLLTPSPSEKEAIDALKENQCIAAEDCEALDLVHAMCVGYWKCKEGQCAWICSEAEAPSSSGGSSGSSSTRMVCHVDESLMGEYDALIRKLQQLDPNSEDAARIQNTIVSLKEKMHLNQICKEVDVQTPTAIAVPISAPVFEKCGELTAWQEKLNHYEEIYKLGESRMKEKGFTSEEVLRIKQELREGVARLQKECQLQKEGKLDQISDVEKPVAAGKPSEISDYYRKRITAVTGSENEVGEQIRELKQLRGEIDQLIERLVKEQESFAFDEMEGLVEEIEVTPDSVTVDSNQIDATNKDISTKLNSMEVRIKQLENKISLQEGNQVVSIRSESIKIQEGKLKIGDKEITIAPSEAIDAANVVPTEVSVEESGGKAVYKVSAENTRRLLWIMPVTVTEQSVVDAENGEVIEVSAPWWGFLAFQ